MNIDLIELKPYITVNRHWISEIFQSPIRQFDGCLKSDTFPIFVVNGSTEYEIGERSLEYRLFTHLSDSGHHFGLIHVMDEIYDHNLSVYGLEQCISIFREYYRPVGGKRQLLVDFGRSFITPTLRILPDQTACSWTLHTDSSPIRVTKFSLHDASVSATPTHE